MKIVVISDTHGDLSALRRVAMVENDADVYLHAGDVEASPLDISPFAAVKGNCDYAYPEYKLRFETKTPFGILHMEHYPIEGTMLLKSMYEDGVRIFIHGHTHEREEIMLSGVRIFCPGSLVMPHDCSAGTYLVLLISKDKVEPIWKTV